MTSSTDPRFSIVTAVYGVAEYLPDFIAAIESQSFDLGTVEVIAVDDGSTDGSSRLLEEWQARRPDLVRVIRQENAGQGAARNAGIAAARGTWITFPDPDDVLPPDYLERMSAFLDDHPEAVMLAATRLMWLEDENTVTDNHPLRTMFRDDRLVDLHNDAHHFHGSSAASFFKLAKLLEWDVRFDARVRPTFEDGHFNSMYLLHFDRPQVGFIGSAKYHYRKRAAGDSSTQRSRAHPDRYSAVLEHGYLEVLRFARERFGEIPGWVQSFLIYDLSWFFTRTDSEAPAGVPLSGPVSDRFHELMKQVLDQLDLDDVVPYVTARMARVPRYVMQHGYRDEPWHEDFVTLESFDERQRLVRATWFFTGPAPEEVFLADGDVVEPQHSKTRALDFCGSTLLRKRIVWLHQSRPIEISLNGKPMDLVFKRPPFPLRRANPGLIRWSLSDDSARLQTLAAPILEPKPTSADGRKAQSLASRPKTTARYRNAWVLMDRIHNAGDSGEILFHHLRKNYPTINAFFVIEKGTPDWRRLKRAGLGDRLIAHGSLQWRLLMANCLHLLSSHCDVAVMEPPAILEFTHPSWRFTFLEHGVIKDDLSGWLNRKEIDVFVTSTRPEHAYLAGDESPFALTTRECQLTGLPRFDRLLEVGARFPPDQRDLVLLTPTWRQWLSGNPEAGSQRHHAGTVLDSEFIQQWLAVLRDERLAETCRRHGLSVAFLPHPNLDAVLPLLDLPSHVVPLRYDGNDVQEFFARARVLVTDFSSIAFNAAFLERPVVYFQFDEDEVLGGGHTGRQGYFEYRRDGFGPVTLTVEDAVSAIVEALDHGPAPLPEYQARIDATFPPRDGLCCDRVVEAVRASIRSKAAEPPVPTPVAPGPVQLSSLRGRE